MPVIPDIWDKKGPKLRPDLGCRGEHLPSILNSKPGTTKTRKVMVVGREEEEGSGKTVSFS